MCKKHIFINSNGIFKVYGPKIYVYCLFFCSKYTNLIFGNSSHTSLIKGMRIVATMNRNTLINSEYFWICHINYNKLSKHGRENRLAQRIPIVMIRAKFPLPNTSKSKNVGNCFRQSLLNTL